MNCPNCNAEPFDSDANFCTHCGTDIRYLKATCVYCDASAHVDDAHESKYCPFCGGAEPFKDAKA